jgi:hypothetical protein
MSTFIQEDGMGNMYNENGDEFVDIGMDVDEMNFPLGDITNFDQYNDLKPPEKTDEDKKEAQRDKV